MKNRKIVLNGTSSSESNLNPDSFSLIEDQIPALLDGEVLVQNMYLSLDPYMAAYSIQAGAAQMPVAARTVAKVVDSRNPNLAQGDILWGFFGWEEYSLIDASLADRHGYDVLRNKIDLATWPANCPYTYALSILGMPGLTAYKGVEVIAKVSGGDSFFVSSAAGAIGLIAGQVAKCLGARIAGSAGNERKVEHLRRIGFDAAFNYKSAPSLLKALQSACPNGIDAYFDNVGGEMLDAVLLHANKNANFALCGMISTYNSPNPYLPRNLFQIVRKTLTLKGLSVYDHYPDGMLQFLDRMGCWIAEGKVQPHEHITKGLEATVPAFFEMLSGAHGIGKSLIELPEN